MSCHVVLGTLAAAVRAPQWPPPVSGGVDGRRRFLQSCACVLLNYVMVARGEA